MSISLLGKKLKETRMEYALTAFFGIGLSSSRKILQELQINESMKPSSLSEDQISSLTVYLRDKIMIEAKLRNYLKERCLSLVKKGCYRGKRHVKRLPVRGQRTSTNAKTNKKLPRRYVL